MSHSSSEMDGSLLELKLWLSTAKHGCIPNRELLIPRDMGDAGCLSGKGVSLDSGTPNMMEVQWW